MFVIQKFVFSEMEALYALELFELKYMYAIKLFENYFFQIQFRFQHFCTFWI